MTPPYADLLSKNLFHISSRSSYSNLYGKHDAIELFLCICPNWSIVSQIPITTICCSNCGDSKKKASEETGFFLDKEKPNTQNDGILPSQVRYGNLTSAECLSSIHNKLSDSSRPSGWPVDPHMSEPSQAAGHFLHWQLHSLHSSRQVQQLGNLLIVSSAKIEKKNLQNKMPWFWGLWLPYLALIRLLYFKLYLRMKTLNYLICWKEYRQRVRLPPNTVLSNTQHPFKSHSMHLINSINQETKIFSLYFARLSFI